MVTVRKKGEAGMGTLIIFIAMILVAAIAASVLISTTGSLQNKALDTGKSTTQEVGTSLTVAEIYAENGNDTNVENFSVIMKLSAGSDPIRFEDLLVSAVLSDSSSDFTYNSTGVCTDRTTFAGSEFAVRYAIEGTDNRAGYLVTGDVAELCFDTSRSVNESEDFSLELIPKVGTSRSIDFTVPDLILTTRVTLFP